MSNIIYSFINFIRNVITTPDVVVVNSELTFESVCEYCRNNLTIAGPMVGYDGNWYCDNCNIVYVSKKN